MPLIASIEPIFGGMTIMMVSLIVAFYAPVLYWLMVPGRKGQLRTERRAEFGNESVESLKSHLESRLHKLGFKTRVTSAYSLSAARGVSDEAHGLPVPHILVDFPATLELDFAQSLQDVLVDLRIKRKTFVYRDTGEGAALESLADYILGSDPDAPLPQPEPHESDYYVSALILSVLGLTAAVAVYAIPWVANAWCAHALACGAALSFTVTAGLVEWCKASARERPEELLESGKGSIARFIAGAAFLVGFLHERAGATETWLFLVLMGIVGLLMGPIIRLNQRAIEKNKEENRRAAAMEKPLSQPVEVEEIAEGTMKIELPLKKAENNIGCIFVWLALWVLGGLSVASSLMQDVIQNAGTGAALSEWRDVAFTYFWLNLWALATGFVIWIVLWQKTAGETLYLTERVLTLERRFAWKNERRDYEVESIVDFRHEEDTSGFTMKGEKGRTLCFEYNGDTVRFGRNIEDPEAFEVERIVRQALSRPKGETDQAEPL